MIFFKSIFLVLSCIFVGILTFLSVKTAKSSSPLKKSLLFPLQIGIFTLIFYTIYVFSEAYKVALVFDSLYFTSLVWLTYAMFNFVYAYIGHYNKLRINKILILLVILDSLSLFINLFTKHSFDLILLQKETYQYWGTTFKGFHTFHLSICYFFVALSLVMMIIETVKSSTFYKQKFVYILITYFLVIFLNLICYSMNLPIDVSVLFYALLASFICYYSIYSFPHHLVTHLLDNVNDKLKDGIIFFDNKGHYAYSNNIARKLMCDSEGNFSEKVTEVYAEAWKSVHPESEKNGRDSFVIDDVERHFTVEYQTLSSDGITIGSFFKFVDKTQETKEYLKERYAATHDELTKLYNRTGFFEAVEEIQHSQRKDNVTYLMLCSNIKDFKLINEIFGDKIGDEILIRQAELIRRYAHMDTVCGRINDDKFAMYMKKDYFNEELFNNCIRSMSKPIGESKYHLQIHIGIYETRLALETPQVMCDKAQMACEQLSNDYQHNFARYDSTLMDKLLEEKRILNDFEAALNENHFKLYLQPQIAHSGRENERYFGTEALVRWVHPIRGVIFPDSFIGILEKNALIHKLDMYVWEKVASKLKDWKNEGFSDMSISINVSSKDLYYIDVYQTLVDIVERYQINPRNLNVEITEAGFMENFEASKKLMESLQNYGFKVEIDDFGSGYSSLNMLKDIKADVLKIGKTFLKETENQERNDKILETIIKMANFLGMEVLAVGVETMDQVSRLNKFGCEHFQGDLFSAPVLIEEFERGCL